MSMQRWLVLKEGITHYPGSMIIVTHDCYFLDKVATHILTFEESGNVALPYSDFQSYKRVHAVSIQDTAGTHRKFARGTR